MAVAALTALGGIALLALSLYKALEPALGAAGSALAVGLALLALSGLMALTAAKTIK